METYTEPLAQSMEALDFTSPIKSTLVARYIEPPILDLSCKKQNSTELQESSSRSNSPTDAEKQQTGLFADSKRKIPFEGRTFMVTPPSESESPKKMKSEPIYTCPNVTNNNVIGQRGNFSVLPIGLPISMVPTISTLYTQNDGPIVPIPFVGTSATLATSTTPCSEITLSTATTETSKKPTRPFKAYPKDPLSLSISTTELIYDQNSSEAYSEFRKRMLESVKRSNEGTNVKMRRVSKSPGLPTSTVDEKDAAYWERRRKNNEAAKRSRDARRAKEDEIAIRAAFLEQENIKLKYELVALKNETAKLKCMVYST